jgi:hypothetical protein
LSYGGDRKKKAKLISGVLPELQMKEEKKKEGKEGREERNMIKCEHHMVSAASIYWHTQERETGAPITGTFLQKKATNFHEVRKKGERDFKTRYRQDTSPGGGGEGCMK